MKLILVALIVLVINVPFGYWRANVKKFSFQWILAIHLPVPLIIFLRFAGDIGFAWYTYVILVSAFFIGQRLGFMLWQRNREQLQHVSSCLIVDLKRSFSK
ncbi:MAG: hypothetical protein AB7E36_00720 [Salinivirgaceae bacterium]